MDTQSTLETKAFYNSLRMNSFTKKGSMGWQEQDFRLLTLDQLFQELKTLGISLDKTSFYLWAANCETPEELLDLLLVEEEKNDHLYLLLFELWRRLLPEKRSLSIVADEIDHVIFAFETEQDVSDEAMESALTDWVRLLENLHDSGLPAREALKALEPFFANDVPAFAIDFFLDVVDRHVEEVFLALFEKVRPYLLQEPLWAKVLDFKMRTKDDPSLLRKKLGELVAHVLTTPDVEPEIIFSLCDIAVDLGKEELLIKLLERGIPDLQAKDELEIACHFLTEYAKKTNKDSVVASLQAIEKTLETEPSQKLQELLLQNLRRLNV